MFRNKVLRPVAWIGIGALLVSGCGERGVPQPSLNATSPSTAIKQLNASQQEQKLRAESVRDRMMQTLMAELTGTLAAEGPARSIKVCKTVAPEVAQQLSKDGIRIGRTSFKLRNPQNTPPDWARPFVEQQVTEPTCIELPQQSLGVLLPIRLKSTCLLCHGDRQQIDSSVKAALVTHYPDDQATGFAEGDLRGYFWVEVSDTTGAPAGDANQ